jgi:RNA polymerase sigma-19 factor, ECF subfamily
MEQSGIENVLPQLIQEHEKQLRRVVKNITGSDDAVETVLQETYLSMLTRFAKDGAPELRNARAYLFHAANTNATHHLSHVLIPARKAQPRKTETESIARQHDPRPGPERMAMLNQAMSALARVLDRITEKQREVFVLGKIDGLRRRDIAELLSLDEGAVDKRMTKALSAVRDLLEREGFSNSG